MLRANLWTNAIGPPDTWASACARQPIVVKMNEGNAVETVGRLVGGCEVTLYVMGVVMLSPSLLFLYFSSSSNVCVCVCVCVYVCMCVCVCGVKD